MYLASYSNQTTRRGLLGLNYVVICNDFDVSNDCRNEVAVAEFKGHLLYQFHYFVDVLSLFGGVPNAVDLDGGLPCDNLFHCYNILSCAILHSTVEGLFDIQGGGGTFLFVAGWGGVCGVLLISALAK